MIFDFLTKSAISLVSLASSPDLLSFFMFDEDEHLIYTGRRCVLTKSFPLLLAYQYRHIKGSGLSIYVDMEMEVSKDGKS